MKSSGMIVFDSFCWCWCQASHLTTSWLEYQWISTPNEIYAHFQYSFIRSMEWWSHLTLRGIDASSNGDILASSPAMAVDSEDMWRLLLGANTVSYMQLLKSSDDPACNLRCGLGWMFFEIQLTFLEVCTPECKHSRGTPGIEMDSFILGSHIWGIGWFLSMFFFPRTGQFTYIIIYPKKCNFSIFQWDTRKYIKIIKYIFSRFGAAPWEIFNCRWDQPQVEPRKDARGRQSTKAQRRGRWRGIREMTGATWGLIWMISTCFGNGLFLWFKMV